jgi:hypothetical protein
MVSLRQKLITMVSNSQTFWEHFRRNSSGFGINGQSGDDIWNFIMGFLYGLDNMVVGKQFGEFLGVCKKNYRRWPTNVSFDHWLKEELQNDDAKFKEVIMEIFGAFLLTLNHQQG